MKTVIERVLACMTGRLVEFTVRRIGHLKYCLYVWMTRWWQSWWRSAWRNGWKVDYAEWLDDRMIEWAIGRVKKRNELWARLMDGWHGGWMNRCMSDWVLEWRRACTNAFTIWCLSACSHDRNNDWNHALTFNHSVIQPWNHGTGTMDACMNGCTAGWMNKWRNVLNVE